MVLSQWVSETRKCAMKQVDKVQIPPEEDNEADIWKIRSSFMRSMLAIICNPDYTYIEEAAWLSA